MLPRPHGKIFDIHSPTNSGKLSIIYLSQKFVLVLYLFYASDSFIVFCFIQMITFLENIKRQTPKICLSVFNHDANTIRKM